jgi:hypothetical protein
MGPTQPPIQWVSGSLFPGVKRLGRETDNSPPYISSLPLCLYGMVSTGTDRLCCLVVTVPGYRSRGPGFDSRRYQIFWEVVGLERGPLSLVRSTEELLEWKSSGSGCRKPRLGWPRDTLYPLKFALTSHTGGGRSVGTVRLRTKATEFEIQGQVYLTFNLQM